MTTNIDAPFGFAVHGEKLRENLYAILTAPTINICINDLVVHGGEMVSTPAKGYLNVIADGAVPDGAAVGVLGAVTAVFDENMMPVLNIIPGTVGDGVIAGYASVADHPYQEYLAQEDADGNAIDLNEAGMNADLICGTLCAPSTITGLSTQEIDSDTAATTETLTIKLIRPYEKDLPATDADGGCRWICQINAHHWGNQFAGV